MVAGNNDDPSGEGGVLLGMDGIACLIARAYQPTNAGQAPAWYAWYGLVDTKRTRDSVFIAPFPRD